MPAKNDDAVGLVNRVDWFAGKPRSNRAIVCNEHKKARLAGLFLFGPRNQ
ncbi:hypothetical protein KDX30_28535 [Pseudomonas sp. CDFA 553]|nr:hypothetical protein [Pseudomonas quasicaspiana]MCD5991842.1 hypothetical protein [Pseudomonas quasicaspiana]